MINVYLKDTNRMRNLGNLKIALDGCNIQDQFNRIK